MKQFIWMLCGIFVAGLLLGTLSACGAEELEIPLQILTEENIAALGHPKPEYPVREPLG